jgi:hypothetical protein
MDDVKTGIRSEEAETPSFSARPRNCKFAMIDDRGRRVSCCDDSLE